MKTNFTKIIFSTFLILFLNNSNAQDKVLKNIDEAKAVSKKITEHFKENEITEAFDILKLYWPLPQNEIYTLENQTVQSLNLVSQRFGKQESIVKVSEQNIQDTAFRETYLLKFENTALRLIFTYYKNSNGWIINAFKWDDNYDEEFK